MRKSGKTRMRLVRRLRAVVLAAGGTDYFQLSSALFCVSGAGKGSLRRDVLVRGGTRAAARAAPGDSSGGLTTATISRCGSRYLRAARATSATLTFMMLSPYWR